MTNSPEKPAPPTVAGNNPGPSAPPSSAPGSVPPVPLTIDTNGGNTVSESAEILLSQAVQLELQGIPTQQPDLAKKVKTFLIGKPRDFADRKIFTHISLIAFLAWVGLGADGLSSSCYGPSEAFQKLVVPRQAAGIDPVTKAVIPEIPERDFTYLAIFLALATIITVAVISACYSHIIEEFPSGGGGYLAASKLLGPLPGVISGCALLLDYVLTITVSIAAAGDALFSLLGPTWHEHNYKLYAEIVAILALIVLNLRGVKESVMVLMPIFMVFLITHVLLIGGAVGLNLTEVHTVANQVQTGIVGHYNNPSVGLMGMLGMFLLAYSFGAGTYTGIEAVSNSMSMMREPRVATGKRTMIYMAISLALTAGGLIVAYMLLNLGSKFKEGHGLHNETLNFFLTQKLMEEIHLGNHWAGWGFIQIVLLSEALLLGVAAQAGFIGGPRLLANMAHDSWVPHWFANLSERLATHNGIVLMGLAALGALLYTGGNTVVLVIMYSINVFVTFSLSMAGMSVHWWRQRGKNPVWKRRLALFVFGGVLCVTILVINVYVKAMMGGWVTLFVTGALVLLCLAANRYYRGVFNRLSKLNESLGQLVATQAPIETDPDQSAPTAAILVGGYSGLGIHTLLNAIRFAPNHFKNLVFLSVAVIDSGNFKGADAVDDLRKYTEDNLEKYVDLARRLGMPSTSYMAMGTDAVDELEHLCITISKDFPKSIFFAGQLVFRKDSWYQRLMHNQTAYSLQRRLQWDAIPMVILPTRVR